MELTFEDVVHKLEKEFLLNEVKYKEDISFEVIIFRTFRGLFQSIVISFFVLLSVLFVNLLPGHSNGKLFPLYIPEHYGPRNSQHLFDPYTFVHFDSGILSYYLFGFLDKDFRTELPDETFESSSLTNRILSDENLGLLVALYMAMAFENIENSPMVINMFREHSGTSSEYRGDSTINVAGDLSAFALGYSFAKMLDQLGLSGWPKVVFFLSELKLAFHIRDNLALIFLQLFYPLQFIKNWQAEVIPAKFNQNPR